MLKREWGAKSNEKLPRLFIASKTATLVPAFAVEDCLWAELQLWCLRLQRKTCSWAEHSKEEHVKGEEGGNGYQNMSPYSTFFFYVAFKAEIVSEVQYE